MRDYFQQHQYDPSHDYEHVERVRRIALKLAKMHHEAHPSQPIDAQVVELVALLHDVGDAKYHSEWVQTETTLIFNETEYLEKMQHRKPFRHFSRMNFKWTPKKLP